MLFGSFYLGGEIKGGDEIWYFYRSDGKRLPVYKDDEKDIYFFNEITLPTSFLQYAGNRNVRLHFLKYGFYQTGFIPYASDSPFYIYYRQYWHLKHRRLEIAKTIVKGEILAISTVVKYFPHDDLLMKLQEAQDISTLMSVEGYAMKYLWMWLSKKISAFNGRVYHPPTDPINATISFAFAHLYGLVFSAIKLVGIDPRIGYLHENRFRTYTLHLDMADLYKPYVVEFVKDLWNRGIIKPSWFFRVGKAYYIKDTHRDKFLEYWDDYIRDRAKKWCGKYSFLLMVVKDMREFRGHLIKGDRPFIPCNVEHIW